MLASNLSSAARFATVVVTGLSLLSSASYANSYEQLFPNGAYDASAPEVRAHYRHGGARFRSGGNGFYSTYPGGIPNDFSSSHVCINGYRWITRELEWFESPAENAIPVRC